MHLIIRRTLCGVAVLLTGLIFAACTGPGVAPATGGAADGTPGSSTAEPTQAAGGQPTPAPTEISYTGAGPWQVTFNTADKVTLSGTMYGDGKTVIILAPAYPGGQEGWAAFGAAAAAKGYRALTFDFRGYGSSKGSQSPADMPADIQAAADYLKGLGAEKIILAGAGLGGSATILAAGKASDLSGVALVSATRGVEGLQVGDGDLTALKIPTLWLAARNDLTQSTEEMAALVGSDKKNIWIYEGSSLHGTYIFDGADGPDMQRRLLEFVAAVTG